jgi:hypothetical protein
MTTYDEIAKIVYAIMNDHMNNNKSTNDAIDACYCRFNYDETLYDDIENVFDVFMRVHDYYVFD